MERVSENNSALPQQADFNASSLLTTYVTSDSLFKAPSFITAISLWSPAAPLAAGTILKAQSCQAPPSPGEHAFPAHAARFAAWFEYGAEISKGTIKTAQDWTLEDTTALENAPTNAFIRGQRCPQRVCPLLALHTDAAQQDASHAERLSLPAAGPLQNFSRWDGKGQRVQRQTAVSLAGKRSGIPPCAAHTP